MIQPTLTRRKALYGAAALITVSAGGAYVYMTAREAAAKKMPLRVLTDAEKDTLSAFGDALVPGAAAAGLVHFVDSQLTAQPNECLLILKYFQIRPPYIDFYRSGLNALTAHVAGKYQKSFKELSADEQGAVIDSLIEGGPKDWQGSPAFLFYLMVRSDGVDVTYGTPSGFKDLGIPFLEHIAPPEGWTA